MPLSDNLVGYWKLDETSGTRSDSHGSNHLTPTGSVSVVSGVLNNAAAGFSGSNYLSCSDNAALSMGDIGFTIQAWYYVTSYVDGSAVVKGASNDLEYDLKFNGARALFRVSSASGFAGLSNTNSDPLNLNQWYHVMAWHNPTANIIGIEVDAGGEFTASYSAGSYDSSAPFMIGSYAAYSQPFPGYLDEVAIWKRVLTYTERSEMYNGGAGLPYSSFGGAPPTTFQAARASRSTVNVGWGLPS